MKNLKPADIFWIIVFGTLLMFGLFEFCKHVQLTERDKSIFLVFFYVILCGYLIVCFVTYYSIFDDEQDKILK